MQHEMKLTDANKQQGKAPHFIPWNPVLFWGEGVTEKHFNEVINYSFKLTNSRSPHHPIIMNAPASGSWHDQYANKTKSQKFRKS